MDANQTSYWCRYCGGRHVDEAHTDPDEALRTADMHMRVGRTTEARRWIQVARKLVRGR